MTYFKWKLFVVLAFVVVIGLILIKESSNLVFNNKVMQTYSMFTNKQFNKQLVRNDQMDQWMFVADERYVDFERKTNIYFHYVYFSDKEKERLSVISKDNFIKTTVYYILIGTFTNEWKASQKIVVTPVGRMTL